MLTSFLAAAGLALMHLLAGKVQPRLSGVPRSRWLSFAGGVPTVFVFLQILPTLARDQEVLTGAAGGALGFLEHHVYIAAFLGLAVFYGLGNAPSSGHNSASVRRGRASGRATRPFG